MGEPDRNRAEQEPCYCGTQPARKAAALLEICAKRLGPENRAHEGHRHQSAHHAQKQKGRQFHIELQRAIGAEAVFRHLAKGQTVDHGARSRGDDDWREGVNGEMAQHDLKRKERARDRGIEGSRDCRRNRAAQKITPCDPVCLDPIGHFGGDHGGQMHHRAFAAS